ncbi:MAG: CC0125/CC1285 family lipoprotein [Planctomycetota bacterium]|jgi:hypothetical protein
MPCRPLSIALALVLAACAEPASKYRPLAGDFGYAEHRLDQDTWRVGFAGSGGTARETVEIFALYRAAEVTLANGRDRFAVLEWETEATETSWAFKLVPLTLQHESSFGYRKATGFPVPSLRPPVTRTTAWAKIRTLPGEVLEDAPVHDARRVIETYGPGL